MRDVVQENMMPKFATMKYTILEYFFSALNYVLATTWVFQNNFNLFHDTEIFLSVVFWCFQGVYIETSCLKWVNTLQKVCLHLNEYLGQLKKTGLESSVESDNWCFDLRCLMSSI